MNKKISSLLLVLTVSTLTGCASIMNGTTQSVSVAPMRDGIVDGNTSCTATNSKGNWYTNGGGSVTVKKSREDLQIKCTDLTTNAIGMQTAKRTTEMKWAVANFFFWDLCTISCLVDFGNGSIYTYPNHVPVMMPSKLTTPAAAPVNAPVAIAPISTEQANNTPTTHNQTQPIQGGVTF